MTIPAVKSTADPLATSPAAPGTSVQAPVTEKNMFLQLLVAQLKHQDPSTPQDATQFVAQLAQFSNLEKTVEMSDNLKTISDTLLKIQTELTPPSATPAP